MTPYCAVYFRFICRGLNLAGQKTRERLGDPNVSGSVQNGFVGTYGIGFEGFWDFLNFRQLWPP